MSNKPTGGLVTYVSQAWLILLLSIVFGCALAGVELVLKDKIAENKLGKTRSKILTFFENGDIMGSGPVELPLENGESKTVWKVVDSDKAVQGWLLPAKGSGYADTIELIVAVDAQCETILGIAVLSQKETPALGDKITKPDFQNGFTKGLVTSQPVIVVKSGIADPAKNEIQAITGATVSSKSVTDIVNTVISELKPHIKDLN